MVRVRRTWLAKATPRKLQNLRTRKLEKRSRAAAVRAGVSFQDACLVGSRRSAAGPAGPWNFPPVAAGNMPAAVAAGARMYVHHIDPVLVFPGAGRIGGVTLLQCRLTRARYQSASGAFFIGSDWHGPLETDPGNGTRVAIRVPPGWCFRQPWNLPPGWRSCVIRPVIL